MAQGSGRQLRGDSPACRKRSRRGTDEKGKPRGARGHLALGSCSRCGVPVGKRRRLTHRPSLGWQG